MPLKKLWNTLRGVTTPDDVVAPEPERVATPQSAAAPVASKPVAKKQAVAKPVIAKPSIVKPVATPVTATQPTPAKPAGGRGILSMLSRGEHDGLVKSLVKLKPNSVLEIGVGDGSRTAALVHALAQSNPSLKYAVIDQFEMVGGDVTLRDFHGRLAGLPIRPAIVPEPATRGIVTVLHRLGLMDVVLIDPSIDEATQAELDLVLGKVSHAGTTVLRQTNGKWVASRSESRTTRRAA